MLWAWFVGYCSKISSSTCREIDDYLLGLYTAFGHVPHQTLLKSPTVNVTVNPVRNILRVRRVKREYLDEVEDDRVSSVVEGSKDSCAVCGSPSFARVTRKDGSRAFLCKKHFNVERHWLLGWAYVKEMSRYG